jgi:hypothetical protein
MTVQKVEGFHKGVREGPVYEDVVWLLKTFQSKAAVLLFLPDVVNVNGRRYRMVLMVVEVSQPT